MFGTLIPFPVGAKLNMPCPIVQGQEAYSQAWFTVVWLLDIEVYHNDADSLSDTSCTVFKIVLQIEWTIACFT